MASGACSLFRLAALRDEDPVLADVAVDPSGSREQLKALRG